MHDKIPALAAGPRVHGRVGIDLCDERGRVLKRVEHDNYVSQRYLDAIALMTRYGALGLTTASSGFDASRRTWMPGNTGALQQNPFTGLLLTDYAGAVSFEERFVRGNLLAYASRGVLNSGTQRGAYNAAESIHQLAHHRFVYDFATSEANGTFQSVYTGPFQADALISGWPATYGLALGFAALGSTGSTGMFIPDGAGGVFRRRETAPWIATQTPLRFTTAALLNGMVGVTVPAAAVALPTMPASLAVRDGRLYWLTPITGSGATRAFNVSSAPLTDLANARVDNTFNAAWLSSIGQTAGTTLSFGLTWASARGTWLMGSYQQVAGGSTPTVAVVELDQSWATVRTFSTSQTEDFSQLVTFPGDPGVVITNGTRAYELDGAAGVLRRAGSVTSYSAESSSGVSHYAPIGDLLAVAQNGSSNTSLVLVPQQFFFSRVLLDDPVTKTSQNTMKITYEFTMDDLVL